MAPTGSRRSGYSRRAQYNLFTGYVIAGIGALIGRVRRHKAEAAADRAARVVATRAHKNVCERRAAAASCACEEAAHACVRARVCNAAPVSASWE